MDSEKKRKFEQISAAQKSRPSVEQRAEFRALARRWHKLRDRKAAR